MIERKLFSGPLPAGPVPLLILGARSTGKTTLAGQWAKKFHNYIYCNLHEMADRQIFLKELPWEDRLKSLYFLKDKHPGGGKTLVFLDEIQYCTEALDWLIHKPAGSSNISFAASASFMTPGMTGKLQNHPESVSVIRLRPLTFGEFLMAAGDQVMVQAWHEVPVPATAHGKLQYYFHLYTLIGGLPGIVGEYLTTGHLASLNRLYEKLLQEYLDDVSEAGYSPGITTMACEILQNSFPFAATRISFNRFGNSSYRSRDSGAAFRILQRHFLLSLIYPSVSTTGQAVPDNGKFPRLQFLDTGLVGYFSGIRKQLFQAEDVTSLFHGQMARQVAGQEIAAAEDPVQARTAGDLRYQDLRFWVRKKAQSGAEVDFMISDNGLNIPVEVKAGEPGRLRSLHQFMDEAPHPFAVRLYSGQYAIRHTQTIRGKRFFLLDLPWFMAGRIREHLPGFFRFAGG